MKRYFFLGLIFFLASSCEKDDGTYTYKEMFSAIDKIEGFSYFKKSIGITPDEKMADFQLKRKLKVFHVQNVNESKHEKLEDLLKDENKMYDLDLFHNPNSGNSIVLKMQEGNFVELGSSVPNSEDASKRCSNISLVDLSHLENRNQETALEESGFPRVLFSTAYIKHYLPKDDLRNALMDAEFQGTLFSCTTCMVIHVNKRRYFQVQENKWSEFELKRRFFLPESLKEYKSDTLLIDSLFVTYDNLSLYRKIINKPYTIDPKVYYSLP